MAQHDSLTNSGIPLRSLIVTILVQPVASNS